MNKEMTINGKSYTIIKLLGKGKGGYSYLAESGNNRYVWEYPKVCVNLQTDVR